MLVYLVVGFVAVCIAFTFMLTMSNADVAATYSFRLTSAAGDSASWWPWSTCLVAIFLAFAWAWRSSALAMRAQGGSGDPEALHPRDPPYGDARDDAPLPRAACHAACGARCPELHAGHVCAETSHPPGRQAEEPEAARGFVAERPEPAPGAPRLRVPPPYTRDRPMAFVTKYGERVHLNDQCSGLREAHDKNTYTAEICTCITGLTDKLMFSQTPRRDGEPCVHTVHDETRARVRAHMKGRTLEWCRICAHAELRKCIESVEGLPCAGSIRAAA
jgi:hypothetical protein